MFNRMRITQADGTGKMPWSPTVVNVERMKKRRGRRAIIIGIVCVLVLCFACSGCWALTHRKAPAQASAQPVNQPAIVEPTVSSQISTPVKSNPAIVPGWTPVPNNPNVSYQVIPYTPAPRQR